MKILDCTLRDGGYYTNWNFDEELVKTYIKNINYLPIDYIEIGYRSLPENNYKGEYYYCPDYLIKKIKSLSNKKLSIMIDEKNVKSEHINELLKPCVNNISLIRLAVNPDNIDSAILLASHIRESGYNFEIGFNIMYMSTWKFKNNFLDKIIGIEEVIDYLYMVDSYGGIYPYEVKELIDKIREKTNVKLGFHSHNNLEMALANTLTSIDNKIDIVDATFTGMGRGAGNLKTELLLASLNSKNKLNVEYNHLSEITELFFKLKEKYKWGTNLPYMVSGANSLPQKDVMEWVSKNYYSINSIIRALENKKNNKVDNNTYPILELNKASNQTLIIGGGPSISKHKEALIIFIKKNPEITIIHASSKNAKPFQGLANKQLFCLLGNEGHRLKKVFDNYGDFNGFCVLPPYPREMGTFVPEELKSNTFELKNIDYENSITHTKIAIQLSKVLESKEIFFAGYDGYSGNDISEIEQELFIENEDIFRKITNSNIKVSLFSLTESKYKSLTPKSVYSLI